jgi:hypothetical protein
MVASFPIAMQEIFDKAWNAVPMPEAPKSLQDLADTEPMQSTETKE